jgi:hypothetical protein
MRRLTIAGILGGLLAVLTACTPADEPIAALAVQDGEPVGLLYVCRDGFSLLSVYEADPADDVHTSWHVVGDATAGVTEIPLLGPLPQGWKPSAALDDAPPSAEPSGPAVDRSRELEELRPDVRYRLSGRSHRNSLTVNFTTADFDRIGGDQVLAANGRDKMKVVSRETFVRVARASCE